VAMGRNQTCSTEGCSNPAAFKTRTKPAWCTECIDRILWQAGLKPAEPFVGKANAWWLTACVGCGVQAHYKLEYILDKNGVGERTCRACFLKSWASEGLATMARYVPDDEELLELANAQFDLPRGMSREEIKAAAENNGFELVGFTAEITDDPSHKTMVVRCRSCGRMSVERMGGIGWGCSCVRNQNPSTYRGRAAKPTLLKDSPDSRAFKCWDHERNTQSDFETVSIRGTRLCHWVCPECGHRFQDTVQRIESWGDCPQCRARRRKEFDIEYERLKHTPAADFPELVAAWDDEADPRQAMVVGDYRSYRLKCTQGHRPNSSLYTFLRSGCPSCRGQETAKNPTYLAEVYPEVASQWHPSRNGKLTPQNVRYNSKHHVWWLADCCGYEWQEEVRDRNKYQRWRCPQCRTILDSLEWHDPGLAAEWSPNNSISAWQVRPTASTRFLPEWICSVDPAHVWNAPLSSRSNGAECPECREAGKSRVELDHHSAAAEVFGNARSGPLLRDKLFNWRKQWTADITVEVAGCTVVIEYDGSYWHSPPSKQFVDERKTLDLLTAGYVVVRLREDDLPTLGIENPRYTELRVYSSAPQPLVTMQQIKEWLAELPKLA
jgi:rubrerythrin